MGRYEPADVLNRRTKLGRCHRTAGSGWQSINKYCQCGCAPAENIGAVCEMTIIGPSAGRGSGDDGKSIVISLLAIGVYGVNGLGCP